MLHRLRSISVCAGLAAGLLSPAAALAQTTAFTYQGQLRDAGAPANGSYDMVLQVYDAATGGNTVGAPQCLNDRAVSGGVFTAQVDPGEFHGQSRYFLEARVRRHTSGVDCSSTTGFTTLVPRQEITAAPFANHARTASALTTPDGNPLRVVTVNHAGAVGIGTTDPSALLDLAGNQDALRITGFQPYMTFRDTSSNNARSIFQGFGGGLFCVGENFMNGTDGTAFTWMDPSGNLAIGHYTPTAKLDVNGNIHASGMITGGARVQRYKTIHGAAFQPETETDSVNPATIRYPDGIIGNTPASSNSVDNYYYATVELPDGAVITNIIVTYYDNGPGVIHGEMYRMNIFNGQLNQMVNFPHDDFNSTSVKVLGTSSILFPTIDNSTYSYVVRLSMDGFSRASGSYMELLAVRIRYETNIPYP